MSLPGVYAYQKFSFGLAGWLLAVSLLTLGGLALAQPKQVNADNCDPVNIVLCGLDQRSLQTDIDSFQASYNSGSNGNHHDLKQVYRWAGATDASVGNMNTSNTKMGTLYRNGDIKVGGEVVGQDAWVAARFTQGAGFVQISSDAWGRKTTTSFAEASAPVIVHFNGSTADFAVMTGCANAVKLTPPPTPPQPPTPPPAPKPHLVCSNLSANQVGDTLQFSFRAKADAQNTTITKYVFDFGDGQQQVVHTSSASADASHGYRDFGQTFHARVTVFSSDFAGGKTSADCTATIITAQKPTLACIGVVRTFTSNPLTNKFTASARATRTNITSYTFTYSDGTQRVIQSNKLTATDAHTFAKNNFAYQVSVAITGTTTDGKNIAAPACMVGITTPGTGECKPGVPIGRPECNVQPCAFDASIPATDTVHCQPPVAAKELLNTGPGDVIGAATGVSLLGTAGRLLYLRRKLSL